MKSFNEFRAESIDEANSTEWINKGDKDSWIKITDKGSYVILEQNDGVNPRAISFLIEKTQIDEVVKILQKLK